MRDINVMTEAERAESVRWFGRGILSGWQGRPPFSLICGGQPFIDTTNVVRTGGSCERAEANQVRVPSSPRGRLLPCPKEQTKPDMHSPRSATTINSIWTNSGTNLELTCAATLYHDFPVIEWALYLKNTSTADTPIISEIRCLDTTVQVLNPKDDPFVIYSNGCYSLYGDDFFPHRQRLSAQTSVRMVNSGGGKTGRWIPFFNLNLDENGILGAVGWAGRWTLAIERTNLETVTLQAGLQKATFHLHPNEDIRLPRIVLLFWKGDEVRAHNLWRRFMLRHIIPSTGDGEPLKAPICCGTWGGMKTHNHMKTIETIKRHNLSYDCYWIDAGWYGAPHETEEYQNFETEDWYFYVGDWRTNTMIHPHGLKPISDAAHTAGMKFLLWCELERAIEGTPLTVEHPEWFFPATSETTLCNRKARSKCFNLGHDQARHWLTDWISKLIEENGIDIFRQDCNMSPGLFWDSGDTEDRVGISEIRYVMGLYEFWTELKRRHPGLVLDITQRKDLDTASFGVDLTRTDYAVYPWTDPFGTQVGGFGLAHWIPITGNVFQMVPGDTYKFRSDLSASMVFSPFKYSQTEAPADYPWHWQIMMMNQARRVRPFFYGDFYPLTECTLSLKDWLAYQMHRPDMDMGMVVAFRRQQSPFIMATFPLRELDPDAVYYVHDMDAPQILRRMTGKALTEEGLTLTLTERHTAALVVYGKQE